MQSRQPRRFGGTSPAAESRVLKAKGLPYSTREVDLQDFFRDYRLVKAALVLEADGRPSGLAFAEFESSEEAVRALAARNGDYIGDRYVKLLRVPHEEMEEQTGGLSRFGGPGGAHLGQPGFGGGGGHSGFGDGSGMAAHERQGLLPQQAPPPPPQPGGWGQQQGNNAAAQGGFASGPTQGFMPQAQQGFGMQSGGGAGAAGWDPMNGPQPFSSYNYYAQQQEGATGGHSFAGAQQQGNYFPGNGLGGMPGQLGPWVSNGAGGAQGHPQAGLPPDAGERPISVLIAEQQAAIREAHRSAVQAAPSYQQAALGSSGGSGGMLGGHSPAASGAPPTLGMGMGQMHNHPATPPPAQGHSPMQGMQHGSFGSGQYVPGGEVPQQAKQRIVKTDGSTVKIRGLPFRATPEEIMAFFDGYPVVDGSLFLGTDARGRPSGEGWLTFRSPEEALRAARDKNRQYMGSRYLELSLC